jgi:hypothetical protein
MKCEHFIDTCGNTEEEKQRQSRKARRAATHHICYLCEGKGVTGRARSRVEITVPFFFLSVEVRILTAI